MARTATVTRNTRETQITLSINLDGTGRADLHTGIGFFDHMLDGFARHGLFDLSVTCHGDLDVDCHHTIEDIGIALGTAIRQALGDKAGLVRYGSCMLPMDETLALCAVDLGGRPYFVYDASFAGQSCGGMDSERGHPAGHCVGCNKRGRLRRVHNGICLLCTEFPERFFSRGGSGREKQKGDRVYRCTDRSGHYDCPAYGRIYCKRRRNRSVGSAQRRQFYVCGEHSRGGDLRKRELFQAQTLCPAATCLT